VPPADLHIATATTFPSFALRSAAHLRLAVDLISLSAQFLMIRFETGRTIRVFAGLAYVMGELVGSAVVASR
jgi:hypothetical protein